MKSRFRRILAWTLSVTTLLTATPTEGLFAAPTEGGTSDFEDISVMQADLARDNPNDYLYDIVEIQEMRGESSKHFRREDGSFSAVSYDVPVHYQLSDAAWAEIDNRLTLFDKSFYTSTNGPVIKNFSQKLDTGFIFTEQFKDYSLTLSIENNAETGQKDYLQAEAKLLDMPDESEMDLFDAIASPDYLSQTILYPEVYEGVDFSYESYSNNIKENITLQHTQDSYVYSFLIEAGELSPKTAEDGSICFYNEAGEVVFMITAPYMIDAGGAASDQVYYELNEVKKSEIDKIEAEMSETETVEFATDDETVEEEEQADTVDEDNPNISDPEKGTITEPTDQEATEEQESEVIVEESQAADTASSPETTDGTIYRLIMKLDEEWLNDPERTYPVVVDPSLEVSSGTGSADITSTYVVEGTPTTKQSNYQSLYVGYGINSKAKRHQVFLHVNNLPSLPDNCLPVAAYLGYYQPSTNGWSAVGISALTLECHELTPSSAPSDYVSWIRNLTWNTKPSYSSTVLDYAILTNSTRTTYSSWNITEAVKKWYENSNTNKGLALIPREDSFSSTRGAVAVINGWGSSYPSRMVVNYRNMVGVEDCYTYETAGIDDAGVSYISDYTNNLTLIREDVYFPSVCQEYSFSHVYNSANHGTQYTVNESAGLHVKNCDAMKTGLGWKLSCQQTVVGLTVNSDYYLIWNDGDGTEHYFKRTPDDVSYFYDEDGLGLTIHRTYPNGGTDVLYTMTDQDKYHTWEFYNGYLSSIKDSNGNAVYIAYNNNYSASGSSWRPLLSSTANTIKQIISVADGQSAVTIANFTYSGGYLQKITDFRGNITQYTYTSGRLTGITKADGQKISYTYNSRGYLSAAEDQETKYGMRFDYISHGTAGADTVSKFWEYAKNGSTQLAGNAYDIRKETTQYGSLRHEGADHATTNTTSGTGADDILQYMSFDHQGRTINVTQRDASGKILGVEAASYTKNSGISKANNKLTSVAASGIEGVNLLYNGGGENTTADTLAFTGTSGSSSGGVTTQTTAGGVTVRPHTGLRMLSASITAGTSYGFNYKNVSLSAGNTYTLSGYVNTIGITASADPGADAGAYLVFTDGSSQILAKSIPVNYKTSAEIESGWEKISVTFTPSASGTYRVGLYLTGTIGKAFADDLQVEKGETFSSTNLLQDGSFEENTANWWTRGSGSTFTTDVKHDGSRALKITGNEVGSVSAYETVQINAPSATSFLLSGWAKASSVPCSQEPESTDNRRFALQALITYTDNTTETQEAYFNSDFTDWQYVSKAIVPKQADKTVKTVKVSVIYNYNANTAYFDQICLKQEPVQTYSYDSDGKLLSAKDGASAKTSYTYVTGTHLLQKYTDLTGVETSLTYEATTHNILTSTSAGFKVTNSYNTTGTVATSKTENSSVSNGTYLQSQSTYSGNGHQLATATNGNNTTTTYGYTNRRLTSEKTGSADAVTYAYNNTSGRLTSSSTGTGSDAVSVSMTYTNGAVSGVTRSASGVSQSYGFAADAFGNITGITVKKGSSTPITLAQYSYESAVNNGRLNTMTYANGQTVSYTYDVFDRIIRQTYSDGTAVHYSYNAEGQLSEQWVTGSDGSILEQYRYIYDSLGRLIHSWQGDEADTGTVSMSQRTEHRYDTADRLTRQSWQLGDKSYSETFTYTNGNLTTYAPAVGSALTYTYDGLNRMSSINGGAYTKTYGYRTISGNRSSLQVGSLSYTHGGTTDSFSYTYDNRGNLSTAGTATYTYDGKNQLTQAVDSGTGITEQMTYDAAGNILTKSMSGTVTESHTYGYENESWQDLLTEYDGQKIAYEGQTYDPADNSVSGAAVSGNPVSYYNGRRWTFTWEKGTRLASAVADEGTADETAISYTYDLNGIRKSKTVNGVTYNYLTQNGQVVRQTWGTSVLDIIYDNNCSPYALNYSTDGGSTFTTCYYLLNLQGDVVKLLDENGATVGSYQYDSWGRVFSVRNQSGAEASANDIVSINPIRYRGYYYDQESGLYYLRSRYYDPLLTRYLSTDKISITTNSVGELKNQNLFSYCDNCPVMREDDKGTFWTLASGALIGAGISASIELVKQYATTGRVDFVSVVTAAAGGAVSGLLAATSLELGGQIALNAIIGGVSEGVSQWRNWNENSSLTNAIVQVGIATIAGGISGVIGGKGIKAQGTEYRQCFDALSALQNNMTLIATPNIYKAELETAIQMTRVVSQQAVKSTVLRFTAGVVSAHAVVGVANLFVSAM